MENMQKLQQVLDRYFAETNIMRRQQIKSQIIKTVIWENFVNDNVPVMKSISNNFIHRTTQGCFEFIAPPHGRIKVYPLSDRLFLCFSNTWISGANKWLHDNVSKDFKVREWVNVESILSAESDRRMLQLSKTNEHGH